MVVIYKQSPSQMTERRIDPWHYQPAFEAQINKIAKNLGSLTLGSIIDSKRGVSSGATPLGANYLDVGHIRFYRTSEVNEMFLCSEEAVFIKAEDDEKLKRSRLAEGDVLLTITGAKFGKSAVVGPKHLPGNISQHSVRFKPDPEKIDAHFLVAYLNCNIGQVVIWREAYGATRPAIDFPSIRSLIVPVLGTAAQKYIGDKIRQAEQLRAWAKFLREAVDLQLNKLDLSIYEPPQMLNRVSVKTLEDRLDPRPYRSHYLNLVKAIEALPHNPVGKLVVLASGCPVPSKDFIENAGVPLVRIRNIGFDDFIGLDTGVNNELYQDAVRYHAKEAMIVIGMDGNFRAQFFVADELPMLVNQRVAMLTPKTIRGELLTHWLNRPEGQLQLNQWAVKTTVEHTSLADIGRILIPRLDVEVEEQCADALLNARLAYRYAKFLTQTAKALVEAIIEGQLTENQLIQAQQALDDGDTSLDQTILSKLSLDGYAVEGAKPLFSDVDELYRLLKSAQAAEEGDI
jgi:type I restriction enzyme S subunit